MKLFELVNELRALQSRVEVLVKNGTLEATDFALLGETISHIIEREKTIVTTQAALGIAAASILSMNKE